MPIQKTPPPGWPHTEAAKYYDQESHKILQTAKPPAPRKRPGCCSGTLVTILIMLAIAGVIAAVVFGFLEEEETDDLQSASDAYTAEYPNWDVESADYPDSSGTVRLVTWDYDRSIGRVVLMEPDELFEGDWVEQPLLPEGTEWSEDQFYNAFSAVFSSLHWTYVVSLEPNAEGTSTVDHVLTYWVWEEASESWGELQTTPAVLDPSQGWLFPEIDSTIEGTVTPEAS